MAYHKARFEDFSFLLFKDDELIGLFPANVVGKSVHSHHGLSYGGLVLNASVKFSDVAEAFAVLLKRFYEEGIEFLDLKLVPRIYHDSPSDEIDYLLFKLNAQLLKAETLSVVQPKHVSLSRDRKQGVRRAEKNALIVREEEVFDNFWNTLLIPNLDAKHQVQPVHSLEEITHLKDKFPNAIRQFNVYRNEEIVAGTTIFESKRVAHSQYISGNADKNQLGSLDLLHYHLLTNVFQDKMYFDFGSSNESDGQLVNKGLNYWKEGFGARTIIHQFYRIDTKNYDNLNSMWL